MKRADLKVGSAAYSRAVDRERAERKVANKKRWKTIIMAIDDEHVPDSLRCAEKDGAAEARLTLDEVERIVKGAQEVMVCK